MAQQVVACIVDKRAADNLSAVVDPISLAVSYTVAIGSEVAETDQGAIAEQEGGIAQTGMAGVVARRHSHDLAFVVEAQAFTADMMVAVGSQPAQRLDRVARLRMSRKREEAEQGARAKAGGSRCETDERHVEFLPERE